MWVLTLPFVARLTFAITLALGATGLSSSESPAAESRTARLVVFLDVPELPAEQVILGMDSISFESGTTITSAEGLIPHLESHALYGNQTRFLEIDVLPGLYESLVLDFDTVEGAVGGAWVKPKTDPEPVRIPIDLQAESGRAHLILLEWEAESLPRDIEELAPESFHPSFSSVPLPNPPIGSLAFVTNEGSDYVSILDRYSRRTVDVIRVGSGPRGMAYSAVRQQLYVANSKSHDLSIIDIASRRAVDSVAFRFGDEPTRIAHSPIRRELYVLHHGSGTLSVLDADSRQELTRVASGENPIGLAVDPESGHVLISSEIADEIIVFDPVTQLTRRVGASVSSPGELLFSESTRELFVASSRFREIAVTDSTNGSSTTLSTCSAATGLALHSLSRRLYVSQTRCRLVEVLRSDSNRVIGSIPVAAEPGLITLGPSLRQLLVVFPEANEIRAFNANSLEEQGRVEVGSAPYMVLIPQ